MLSWPQGHSAAGRIRSIEKSSDLIGNWTHNLLACNIMPQQTMLLPLAPDFIPNTEILLISSTVLIKCNNSFFIQMNIELKTRPVLMPFKTAQYLCPTAFFLRSIITPSESWMCDPWRLLSSVLRGLWRQCHYQNLSYIRLSLVFKFQYKI
jgi:hypothetical protein